MSVSEFNQQFMKHKKALISYALKLTHKPEDAKDLVQETALKAFSNRNKFKEGSNFRAWTLVIMRNTYINQWRKNKKRDTRVDIEDYISSTENTSVPNTGEQQLTLSEINKIITNIGETYSVPIQMLYEGYRYKEIASYLMLPIGTIKSRIFFARKQIKEQMELQYV